MDSSRLLFVVNQKDHKSCRIQLLVVVIFHKLKQHRKVKMIQYTNCVVKAHEVETVKLSVYKYKS